jgi:hypothetical protein
MKEVDKHLELPTMDRTVTARLGMKKGNTAVSRLLQAIEASDLREAAYSDGTQIINVAAWSTGQYYVASARFGRGQGTRTYASLDDMLAGDSVVRDLANRQVWAPIMCAELYAWD